MRTTSFSSTAYVRRLYSKIADEVIGLLSELDVATFKEEAMNSYSS